MAPGDGRLPPALLLLEAEGVLAHQREPPPRPPRADHEDLERQQSATGIFINTQSLCLLFI